MSLKEYHNAINGFPGLEFDQTDYSNSSEMVIGVTEASGHVKNQIKHQAKERGLNVSADGESILISL